jgi:hypothetical protein
MRSQNFFDHGRCSVTPPSASTVVSSQPSRFVVEAGCSSAEMVCENHGFGR